MQLRIPMPVVRVTRTLTVIYVCALYGTVAVQRPILFPWWSVSAERAAQKPRAADVETVTVETSDGERLKAFWKPPAPGAPVIVSFHGRIATPRYMTDRFSHDPWAKSGYGVIAITYRGYPGSTGWPSEDGMIEDARSAVAYAKSKAPDSPIVIHGHSMGSGPAVALATEFPALALILDAPFTSYEDAARFQFPVLPTKLIWDRFDSVSRMPDVKAKRIFVVHGTDDGVIPVTQGEALAATRPDVDLSRVKDGNHWSILGMHDIRFEREISALARRESL